MKRLLLMRHAEAQDPKGRDDKARLLTDKGRDDMRRLHAQLLSEGLMPQFAVASDAHRTRLTLEEVTGSAFTGTKRLQADLYNASADTIISTVQMLDDDYDDVLLVAHNPGIHAAIMTLADSAGLRLLQDRIGMNYRSGTLTVFECPVDKWAELKPGTNRLGRLIIPV